MSLRNCSLALSAILSLAQWGCCGLGGCPINWGPGGSPCERTWWCSSCGPVVWHEWFSFPPMCCDNCNHCGQFTASNNPYVLSGPTHARFGPLYDDGGRRTARPTPAATGPAAGPTPAEELPPAKGSTGRNYREFGDRVSYRARPDEPRRLRDLSHDGEFYDDEAPRRRFDSPQASRTLGEPPRPLRLAR